MLSRHVTPRNISVLTDNESWVLPYSRRLVDICNADGHQADLYRNQSDLPIGDAAFFLGCIHIVKTENLARNKRNLVVHASDLPAGRGFSPWTWQVLEGSNTIPICLLEAAEEADAGPVIYKDKVVLSGNELVDEIRRAIGESTVKLCKRFLDEPEWPCGVTQSGQSTYYPRRTASDSELDIDETLRSQFNLLRVVDNDRYPAFFRMNGATYRLRIDSIPDGAEAEND